MKTIEELCEDMCKARLYSSQLGRCNTANLDYKERIDLDVRYQMAHDDYQEKATKYYAAVREKAKQEAL